MKNIRAYLREGVLLNLAFTIITLAALGIAYLALQDSAFYCEKLCNAYGTSEFSFYPGKCECVNQPLDFSKLKNVTPALVNSSLG